MDPASYEAKVGGKNIELTAAEFRILYYLASHPGRVFHREQLLAQIDGDSPFENYERTVDTHIKNIRKKIEKNPKDPVFVKTVWGVGYKFEKGDA